MKQQQEDNTCGAHEHITTTRKACSTGWRRYLVPHQLSACSAHAPYLAYRRAWASVTRELSRVGPYMASDCRDVPTAIVFTSSAVRRRRPPAVPPWPTGISCRGARPPACTGERKGRVHKTKHQHERHIQYNQGGEEGLPTKCTVPEVVRGSHAHVSHGDTYQRVVPRAPCRPRR